jgi:endo-1,4-beta-mannosidase
MIIEEYGQKIDSGVASRDAVFQTWLDQVVASQGAGALAWMIASTTPDGQRYPDYDHYTVYSVEDAPAIWTFARTPPPANLPTASVAS